MTKLLFVVLMLMAGCASQPARIELTPSGRPEVVISTSDRSAIKQQIIARNVAANWTLEQEGDSTLVFRRPFDDTALILGSALIGNRAMRVGMQIRYTIVQVQGSTKVFVNPFNDLDVLEFNRLQMQLRTLKREIEGN